MNESIHLFKKMSRTFENEYNKYGFDICPHCNLFQKKYKHLNAIQNANGMYYMYECVHCHSCYTFMVPNETANEISLTLNEGFTKFIMPEYIDEHKIDHIIDRSHYTNYQ